MDHAHLYRSELASLCYGRPVWEPDPGTLYDCIQIGDVGYFQNEKFLPLFNILPPNDSNRNRRLPLNPQPDFPALQLPDNFPATHNTTPLNAALHAVDSSLDFSAGISSAGSVLSGEASCSFANEKGAALILPFEAFREDTLHNQRFKKHMLAHYKDWYHFALDFEDIKLEDLILVSGCDLTRKWTTATYFRSNRAVNATLGAQVAPVAEFKFSLSAGWRTSSAITTRPGPYHPLSLQDHEETLVNNQCIFLRGFCVKNRFLGKTLKAAAGYHDPGTYGPEEEGAEGVLSDENVTVGSLSLSPPGESLMTVLLDYMLEESDADVVIANDSDLWPYLGREGDLDNLRDTLKRISPHIKVEDGVGSLIAEGVETVEFQSLPGPSLEVKKAEYRMSEFISNLDTAVQHLQQRDNQHVVFPNEPLATGASNISPEIDSATKFEPTMTLFSTDIKRQNSTMEAPGTIQDVGVTSDASSHCGSILIDTSAKVILQGRLIDLNNLIRGEDGQAIPQDLEKLIVLVLSEIDSWLNQGALMEFEAQVTLSNIAYNGPTKDNTPNQISSKDEKSLLAGYLSILRSATGNGSLTDEKRQILLTLLRESEEFVNELERAKTPNSHRDELNLLHIICDSDIALHSVELAIQLISRGNTASQSRAQGQRQLFDGQSMQQQVQQGPALQRQEIERLKGIHRSGGAFDLTRRIERLLDVIASAPLDSANRPALLNDLGMLYQSRFDLLEEVADLNAAVERKFEAVASTPLNSADRPGFLNNLGSSYRCRFERLGERKDIDSAIERQLEAVTSTPLNGTDRSRRLNNLGNSYQSRFEKFGEADDLNWAIKRQVEAVDSTPVDSPDQPLLLNNLGNSYTRRFKRFGEVKDIDLAIEQQIKAVASTAVDSPYRAVFLTNLGSSYLSRFERLKEMKDLDSAIERQCEAVASTPLHNPNRPVLLGNLGNSYHSRFERFGEVKDLTLAIERNLEAVASTPLDSADRPRRLNNLGNSYIRRFERLGERKDLDSAFELQLKVVASTPLNSAYRPGFLNSLGFSYKSRFEWFGDVKDIDSAIDRACEAVASTPLDNAERPTLLTNLGDSYRCRFERFGEVKDIDLAIKQTIEAVTSTPLDDASRPGRLNNLGISYIRRFQRFGEVKDVDLAIERQVEAVASTPVNSRLRPVLLSNLGISYQSRFERFGKEDDLNLAIKKNLEAVASSQLDSADRSLRLNNLGNSYIRRFEKFGEVEDIDSAIKYQVEAIASTPLDSTTRPGFLNNLGISHHSRFKRFGEVKDIDLAIKQKLEAVASTSLDNADRPAQLNSLGSSYMHRFESLQEHTDFTNSIHNFRLSSLSPNGLPSLRIAGSLQWARLTHQVNDLRSASEAYDQAIRLLPQVAWIGLNAVAQLNELNSGIQTLGCDAAACMIMLAQTEPHHEQRHLGHAIELLDQGRSILWSQTSNFKRDLEDLKKVDSQLASDLDLEGKTLGQGCFRDLNDTFSETDAQSYRRSAEKWEELVHRIRDLPGFQHFLLPSPISTLRTAAADGPVVIINPSQYRCDALIIPPQGDLVLVPLPDSAVEELKILTNQQEEFASRKSKSVWIPSNYHTPSTTLEQVLNQTWLLVGEPILQKFKELRLVTIGSEAPSKMHVWWCLTGSFSFLPIHASFPPTQPAIGMMDIVVSSYTPTISALLRAQNHNKLPTFRMLAVGQSKVSGMTQLPGVAEEIAFISHILGAEATTLQEYNATVDAVAASLPTCSWAHFACHGVQDLHKPMDSGLVMWNAYRLTLSRIAQSSLTSAEFAFLSSCQSATGSQQFPNEAVHLAAGLQFIGFRGVIGTMWSVGDKDALNVAKEVYKELFKNGTDRASPSEAALALHKAIHQLRGHVPLVRWVPFVHFGL